MIPQGLDPYSARQHLLHHTYLPLISVQASLSAEVLVQLSLQNPNASVLSLLKLYGNNAKHSIANQTFEITNTQLITKNYPSFPVRFEPSLPELLSILTASNDSNKLKQLFSISSLERLLKHTTDGDFYLQLFNKIITSNNVVPFETFNHPVAQVFVIDYLSDDVDVLRGLIVSFRNSVFPKFFQIEDLLIHVFIMYDSSAVLEADMFSFQTLVKKQLSVNSTAIPINTDSTEIVTHSPNENSTIEEDLQRITLNQCKSVDELLSIPKSFDSVLKIKIHEFINKSLIPHMERKIRTWDDQVLGPKKSFTGRFFSVSRKLFNNDQVNTTNTSSTFNYQENYYPKSSTEQIIRKLADWSLILKDFKYAYSTYDFIKKDYTNDKAWVYVASTQEMCIVSLLLAQTQQVGLLSSPPDKNTLRKIRHDIIEPYIDNLSYTFKSRLNVKTYSLKALLIVVELLLCMCITFNISWWWNDLIERYICKCINEFDSHLASNNQSLQMIRAILYERLGYAFGKCTYVNKEYLTEVFQEHPKKEVEEGFYENTFKSEIGHNAVSGLTRFRKSAIWYLLAIKEWMILKRYDHIESLLPNIKQVYDVEKEGWFNRSDLLLGIIKKALESEVD